MTETIKPLVKKKKRFFFSVKTSSNEKYAQIYILLGES